MQSPKLYPAEGVACSHVSGGAQAAGTKGGALQSLAQRSGAQGCHSPGASQTPLLLNGRYEVVECIRKTRISQVLCCRDRLFRGTGSPQNACRFVAIKAVRSELAQLAAQEFDILSTLQAHGGAAHVVEPIELFEHGGVACLVLELLGTCLHDVCRTAPFVTHGLRQVAFKVLHALSFLHGKGVIHADVKPGNVSFDLARSTVKLIDFGNAMELADVSLYFDQFEVQTLRYRAPEVLFGCHFGPQIDVWSAALTLLEAGAGRPVFTSDSPEGLVQEWSAFFGPGLDLAAFRDGKLFRERVSSIDRVSAQRCCGHDAGLHREPGSPSMALGASDGGPATQCADAHGLGEQPLFLAVDHGKATAALATDCEAHRDAQLFMHTKNSVMRFLFASNPELARCELAVDALSRMLSVDPSQRPSAAEALSHPFFHSTFAPAKAAGN